MRRRVEWTESSYVLEYIKHVVNEREILIVYYTGKELVLARANVFRTR